MTNQIDKPKNPTLYRVADIWGGYESSEFETYELARAFIKSLGRKYRYLRVVGSDYIVNNAPADLPAVPTAEQWTPQPTSDHLQVAESTNEYHATKGGKE